VVSNHLFEGNKLTYGSIKDPLLPKLINAINNANIIEVSVSFIQPSGINLLLKPLEDALENGVKVSILTSDYLAITHPQALSKLMRLQDKGAVTKIYQCNSKESFHMKSYIFVANDAHHKITDGCAFVGSNNISYTALNSAHEWCLRYDFSPDSATQLDHEFEYIRDRFFDIISSSQSHTLTHSWIANYAKKRAKQQSLFKPLFVDDNFEEYEPPTPNEMQQQALTALNQTRGNGFKRGLVVLATGMGKTWLSAFDVMQTNAKKVLFVAHRQEILTQAQDTFIDLVSDARTGLYNGNQTDPDANFLFASIQTIGRQAHLDKFAADHFDYIIVDEFHHASAPVYNNLLAHFKPQFLLGLTATPERTDQADILSLVDNNLVFECNLVHGIDADILAPFEYHGIYDEYVDYQEIPWRNGKFVPSHLDNAFATQKRANHIYQHWSDLKQTRTLAFCISKQHADFMATKFSALGYKSAAVYSNSAFKRNQALTALSNGTLDIIFSVDLFNEGTDLPAIDTILMIRPTESKILFLQQLGRGLRKSHATAKTKLVVIDFIGNHQSFLNKPAALLGGEGLKGVISNTAAPKLPDGCHVNYDVRLTEFWQELQRRLKHTAQEEFEILSQQLGHRPTATEFFQHGYSFSKVKKQHGSWFRLVQRQAPQEHDKVDKYHDFLAQCVEHTAMVKCFKPILLQAFLELDGFTTHPTTQQLAQHGWDVLARRPDLKSSELPHSKLNLARDSKAWHSYWLSNPINAFTTPNKKDAQQWFSVIDGKFVPNFVTTQQDLTNLDQMMQELVDYRLAKYIRIKADKLPQSKADSLIDDNVTRLPFYPDLRIACGHFKTGFSDNEQMLAVSNLHGKLSAETHFVAPAIGDSMNGGSRPICDGDLLLLEWVTPTSAGTISNLTMAIERTDATGDNEYLLRVVKKQADGQYLLHANNPDFSDKLATDDMKTFARFVRVVDSC